MKNIVLIYLSGLMFVLSTIKISAQSQIFLPPDWIRQQEDIPIHTWLYSGFAKNYPAAIDSMKMAGVKVVTTDLIDPEDVQSFLYNKGLKTIHVRSRSKDNNQIVNWIQYYTDAKYSVWEAEGNINYDANLKRNLTKTEIVTSGSSTFARRRSDIPNSIDTLLFGPYYTQDVYHHTMQDTISTGDLVLYNADFSLMLEHNSSYPPTEDNPNDTICRIQVTQSYIDFVEGVGFKIISTYPIKDSIIKRSDFSNLNQFVKFSFEYYNLENDSCQFDSYEPDYLIQQTFPSRIAIPENRQYAVMRFNIEYKVIWLGNPKYLLSVDNVIISDERGRELKDSLVYPNLATQRLNDQANSLSNNNVLAGWLGVDEPVSIDKFEPIKVVKEILDDNSGSERPLWLAWMGSWSGKWDPIWNPFGVNDLSKWVEFKKRVGKAHLTILQALKLIHY